MGVDDAREILQSRAVSLETELNLLTLFKMLGSSAMASKRKYLQSPPQVDS